MQTHDLLICKPTAAVEHLAEREQSATTEELRCALVNALSRVALLEDELRNLRAPGTQPLRPGSSG